MESNKTFRVKFIQICWASFYKLARAWCPLGRGGGGGGKGSVHSINLGIGLFVGRARRRALEPLGQLVGGSGPAIVQLEQLVILVRLAIGTIGAVVLVVGDGALLAPAVGVVILTS